MKTIIFLLVFIQSLYAQNYLNDITSMQFFDSAPYIVSIQVNQDFNSPYLVRWGYNKLSGEAIHLLPFDSFNYVPAEIISNFAEIDALFSQAISDWNNSYSLQLDIQNNNAVLFGFAENQDFFINPNLDKPEPKRGKSIKLEIWKY